MLIDGLGLVLRARATRGLLQSLTRANSNSIACGRRYTPWVASSGTSEVYAEHADRSDRGKPSRPLCICILAL